MQKLLTKLIDLIYENSCLICNEPSKAALVCNSCEDDFTPRKENNFKKLKGITVYSWGVYGGKLREGIISLKAGKKKLASYFSTKLIYFWKSLPNEINNNEYLVIPVPSHKKRIKERSYCQTSLIAFEFAQKLGLNYSKEVITRAKETLFMNGLEDINERIQNIKDAFKITNAELKEKNLLIIDDIVTSGSTMDEIAKTIHKKYPDIKLTGLTIASGDKYN